MPRRLVGELMDDPSLDAAQHAHALAGLARLNALSGVSRQIYRILAREASLVGRSLTIVDVATGSADLPVAILRQARRDGVDLRFMACDISSVALAQARERAAKAGVELETRQLDILHEAPPPADVAMCSLFLHHLQDEYIRSVLGKMASAGRQVVISDLRRGPWGLALAAIIPRLVTRSRVVHVDAVRSVRAALTIGEARSITRGIADESAWQIDRAFPARMLIRWPASASTTRS